MPGNQSEPPEDWERVLEESLGEGEAVSPMRALQQHHALQQAMVQFGRTLLESKDQKEFLKKMRRLWRAYAPWREDVRRPGRPSSAWFPVLMALADWHNKSKRPIWKVSAYRLQQYVRDDPLVKQKGLSNSAIRKHVKLYQLMWTPWTDMKPQHRHWLKKTNPALFEQKQAEAASS